MNLTVNVSGGAGRWHWLVEEEGDEYARGEARTPLIAWKEAVHYADPIVRESVPAEQIVEAWKASWKPGETEVDAVRHLIEDGWIMPGPLFDWSDESGTGVEVME